MSGQVSMSYQEWMEYAITEYDLVSKYYSKKVYEAMVQEEHGDMPTFVQLTLREVMNKCQGTVFEDAIRRAIMHCVYTGERPDKYIRKVMDDYYGI